MTPKVSIIVPCYNAEKFIATCIEAIQAQTLEDFEIIFVNDGSDDNTAIILDAINSDMIKIVHKSNGGVSSARNAGLDVARGEWVTFVDADDKLMVAGLDTMLRLATNDCDAVFAGYKMYENGVLKKPIPALREADATTLELARELFAPTDYHYLGFPWGKLFRRSVIEYNHIRFNEAIKYNEDRLFTFIFLSFARQGAYTTEPVYEYYLHGGNAMAAIEGPNFYKFETDLDAFVEMSKIAPRFNSREITKLLQLGTWVSFRWNRRLNRQYGGNRYSTNRRLYKKFRQVVPLNVYLYYKLANIKAIILNKLRAK